jgi:hypothetical protein
MAPGVDPKNLIPLKFQTGGLAFSIKSAHPEKSVTIEEISGAKQPPFLTPHFVLDHGF